MYEFAILRRLLFWLAVLAAVLLLACVLAAPWLDDPANEPRDAIALFARDAALRRTSVASALGLVVTACVFFRRRRLPPTPHQRSSTIAGA